METTQNRYEDFGADVEGRVPNSLDASADLAGVLKELDNLRAGLGLLGVKQCSCCRKYLRCTPPTALLNAGQLVCYNCLESWWQQRSPTLTLAERRNAERQILRWLVAYHGAKVIRNARHMPNGDAIALKIVVGCEQCAGQGTLDDRRCLNCDGRGSEWVIVPKSQMG